VKRRVLVIGLLVACVLASLLSYGLHRRPRTAGVVAPADSARAGVKTVRLYFGAVSGDSLVSESRELVEQATLHDRVAGLVAELDLGPRGRGVAVLPAGTSVLHVYLDDHGLMTLDLSGAFLQRFRGGSSTEYLAIASLVRTLGANVPEVKRLLVVCAGRPIASLGGHLALDRPLDIGDWP
jgi:hypothetical protein